MGIEPRQTFSRVRFLLSGERKITRTRSGFSAFTKAVIVAMTSGIFFAAFGCNGQAKEHRPSGSEPEVFAMNSSRVSPTSWGEVSRINN